MATANDVSEHNDNGTGDSMDGDEPTLNPNSLVFTIGEVITIIVFLNLIFCIFVGWKSRKDKLKGYEIVKVIDSSSEFVTETEIDIGIDVDEEISRIHIDDTGI